MNSIFDNFQNLNVLIIGDLMLDIYISGHVNRISAEAPIPVLDIQSKEYRLGGAANVAANIKAMGANPYLCSLIGNDEASIHIRNILKKKEISDHYIINSEKIKTTTKTRFLSQFQQILRVDDEVTDPIDSQETSILKSTIDTLLIQKKIDAIVFQDYDKGIITPELIKYVVGKAKSNDIPITVDPKFRNFNHYNGVTLFKPNFKEFCNGTKTHIDINNTEALSEHAEILRKSLNVEIIMITLSEKGMFIKNANSHYIVPTYVKSVYDVSGAGDTVISIATLALCIECDIDKIAILSNISGGIVCEETGVVPINKEKLISKVQDLMPNIL